MCVDKNRDQTPKDNKRKQRQQQRQQQKKTMEGGGNGSGKQSFFTHVFNFDDDSKHEMMNIVQYALIALIPVVVLNKLMQKWVPEADDEKGSFELAMEVVLQLVFMFLVMLMIHRIITYIPTYSGEKYAPFSLTNVVMAMLVILLSLQTKLGEKVSILVDRVVELWNGGSGSGSGNSGSNKKNKKKPSKLNPSQGMTQQAMTTMGTTPISALPPTQQQPNYDQMYQHDSTPLVGASNPADSTMMSSAAPMAANEGIGGSFGSMFGNGW